MIYFIVGLLATTLGAIAGLGGGVIIKPVLDALGQYSIGTIGILSSATVLSMAIVSLVRALINKVHMDGRRTLILSFGSIIGGVSGKTVFRWLLNSIPNPSTLGMAQSLILALLMVIVLVLVNKKESIRTYNLTHPCAIFVCGFMLGLLSAFLGIGGGPLNVAILALLFSMDTRDAIIHSILIIFFSQFSGLMQVAMITGFSPYQLEKLIYMIPGGIIGGVFGSQLSHRISTESINKLFNSTLVMIICLNLFNAWAA